MKRATTLEVQRFNKLERLAKALASALRMQAQYHSIKDEQNCWCAGKHMGSTACLTARRILKRYALTVGDQHG